MYGTLMLKIMELIKYLLMVTAGVMEVQIMDLKVAGVLIRVIKFN